MRPLSLYNLMHIMHSTLSVYLRVTLVDTFLCAWHLHERAPCLVATRSSSQKCYFYWPPSAMKYKRQIYIPLDLRLLPRMDEE